MQVEADPNTQEVRAVTGVGDGAAVQLQAFAAPRSEGLWDEIRAEMLAELAETAGAKVSEGEGSFGPEVRGMLPARTPEGEQVTQPVRFVGIDGPRWFLRAVFLGRAAVEPDPNDALHLLVRQTIVVRGPSAMAPRDPLPLTLPAQPVTAEEAAAEEVDRRDRGWPRSGSRTSTRSSVGRRSPRSAEVTAVLGCRCPAMGTGPASRVVRCRSTPLPL